MTSATIHVDPPELFHNPAFAQGVIAPAGRTLYVGGQNGVDGQGRLLEGVEAQTAQAMRNVLTVLAAAGTDADHVAKMTIYLASGIDGAQGFAAARPVWGDHRTAITVVTVAGFARPGVLVETDAVAMIPE